MALRAFEYDRARLSEADRHWLANLPDMHTLAVEGVQVELFHAAPGSLVEQVMPWASLDELCRLRADESTRLVLFGHIHHAYVRQARGRLVVNAGSIGAPFDGDNRASYAIVDVERNGVSVQVRRVEYDVERALQVARDCAMPDVDAFEYALRHARYPYHSANRE